MPPTVQSGGREDRERRVRGEKRSDLVCKVKYNNTLPDIPFDPKFITYPFESNRFVEYNPTSLERAYKHELLTEHDLGITIDLINPDTYKIDPNAYLELEDEKLLEEEVATVQDSKRSRHHNKNVSWLRKTEYISTEYNRFIQSAEKAESRVGFSIKKHFKEEELYKDRDSQIKAIEDTFDAAKIPITKHYSKPGVTPVDILPIFPDFEMWKHPCAQVIFDSDPAPKGRAVPAQIEEMSQAMIRGMVDDQGEQFVAYFLPTEETLGKRKRDAEAGVDHDPEDEYDYVLAREYNWNVKNKASKGYEETYFFVAKEDGVYYNELETRVRLSKRRKIGQGAAPAVSNSRLIVKHREPDEQESAAQDARLTMLEPPMEEEEEEEMQINGQELGMGLPEGVGEEEAGDDEGHKSGDEDADAASKSGSEKGAGSGDEAGSDSDAGKSDKDDDRGSVRSRGSRGSGSDRSSRAGSRAGSRSPSGSERRGSGSERGSAAGSGSDSGSESEAEQKKDEEEIFGSGSSDESD